MQSGQITKIRHEFLVSFSSQNKARLLIQFWIGNGPNIPLPNSAFSGPSGGSGPDATRQPQTGGPCRPGRYVRSGQNSLQRLGARERAIPQLHRRHVAAPKSERFVQWFSGKCHIPLSVWILPPPRHGLNHEDFADSEPRRRAAPPERFCAGTAPFLGIFVALSSSHFPILGLLAPGRGTPSRTIFRGLQVTLQRRAQGVGPDPPDGPMGWYDPPHCPPCRIGRDFLCQEAAP